MLVGVVVSGSHHTTDDKDTIVAERRPGGQASDVNSAPDVLMPVAHVAMSVRQTSERFKDWGSSTAGPIWRHTDGGEHPPPLTATEAANLPTPHCTA